MYISALNLFEQRCRFAMAAGSRVKSSEPKKPFSMIFKNERVSRRAVRSQRSENLFPESAKNSICYANAVKLTVPSKRGTPV